MLPRVQRRPRRNFDAVEPGTGRNGSHGGDPLPPSPTGESDHDSMLAASRPSCSRIVRAIALSSSRFQVCCGMSMAVVEAHPTCRMESISRRDWCAHGSFTPRTRPRCDPVPPTTPVFPAAIVPISDGFPPSWRRERLLLSSVPLPPWMPRSRFPPCARVSYYSHPPRL